MGYEKKQAMAAVGQGTTVSASLPFFLAFCPFHSLSSLYVDSYISGIHNRVVRAAGRSAADRNEREHR